MYVCVCRVISWHLLLCVREIQPARWEVCVIGVLFLLDVLFYFSIFYCIYLRPSVLLLLVHKNGAILVVIVVVVVLLVLLCERDTKKKKKWVYCSCCWSGFTWSVCVVQFIK